MKPGRILDSGKKNLHHLEASLPQGSCLSIQRSQVNSVEVITFLCNLSKTEKAIYSIQIQWGNAMPCDNTGLCSSSEALSSPTSEEGGEISAEYICCSEGCLRRGHALAVWVTLQTLSNITLKLPP